MKLIFTLAWRNLWRNRKRSMITISSVLFAVLLAIIFDSMERGSYERMIDTMVKYSTGYIQIQDVLYEEEPSIDNSLLFDDNIVNLLEKHANRIDYYVPRLQNFALAATDDITRGALIIGVSAAHELKLNNIQDDLVAGDFLTETDEDIVLSEGLAEILHLQIGDTLILLGQGFQGSTAAGKYRVKGIVDLKVPELNNNTIYMSLQAAQWFYMADNRLTSIIVMPDRPRHTNQLASDLRAEIDTEWYAVLTWEHLLSDLLAMMKFDRAGSMAMMIILYIVITFGLFGTILTMMIERQREFGMLISLGMKRTRLAAVCFLESVFISVTGILAGILISIPIVLYFYYNPVPLGGEMAEVIMEYGFEPVLPFSAAPDLFIQQAKIVLVLGFLVGLYPVYRVFNLNIMNVKK